MKALGKKIIAAVLAATMTFSVTGCASKNTRKPVTNQPTPTKKQKASGKTVESADTPLIIGTTALKGNFNPVFAKTNGDKLVADLTQLPLFQKDRAGNIVKKGIEGETRTFKSKEYTYYGPADMKEVPLSNKTKYYITLGNNLKFSDGKPVTADDLIFSMYLYCDQSYQGTVDFSKLNIIGLSKYRAGKKTVKKGKKKVVKKVTHISGIKKIDDTQVCVSVKGYSSKYKNHFVMPVLPLHYYGSNKEYNYDKNKFGFKKGDLTKIRNKKKEPLGAGPYAFVKYEDGVVYYEANDKYYMGMPKTVYLQVKKVNEAEAAKNLADGVIDAWNTPLTQELCGLFAENNTNAEVSGKTISVKNLPDEKMHYIGMNAKTVCVDGKTKSIESILLRKAFATIFSVYRQNVLDKVYYGQIKALQYPVSSASALAPTSEQEDYRTAYSRNKEGDELYDEDSDMSDMQQAARTEALSKLKRAGYKIENYKVVSGTKERPIQYTILVEGKDVTTNLIIKNAIGDLRMLGFKIKVKHVTKKQLAKEMKKGKHQIWCTTENITGEADLSKMFGYALGQNNHFSLFDLKLDKVFRKTKEESDVEIAREYLLRYCNKVMNYGVIVPIYQEQECAAFSYPRIKMSSTLSNGTLYYDWIKEIDTVRMK